MGLGGGDGGEGVADAGEWGVLVGVPVGLQVPIRRRRVQPWLRPHGSRERAQHGSFPFPPPVGPTSKFSRSEKGSNPSPESPNPNPPSGSEIAEGSGRLRGTPGGRSFSIWGGANQ